MGEKPIPSANTYSFLCWLHDAATDHRRVHDLCVAQGLKSLEEDNEMTRSQYNILDRTNPLSDCELQPAVLSAAGRTATTI